jgi:mycoredoxin
MSDETIDGVDFYWRPGCGFCMMLDRSLSKSGVKMNKHNIWDAPSHADVVRQWANGNETVPTVVIGDVGLVNPSSDDVLSVVSNKAPHLLPEGWKPPEPGRIAGAARRLLGG